MLSDFLGTTRTTSTSSGSVKTHASLLDFITGGPTGSVHTYRGSMTPNMEQIVNQMLQRVQQERANL